MSSSKIYDLEQIIDLLPKLFLKESLFLRTQRVTTTHIVFLVTVLIALSACSEKQAEKPSEEEANPYEASWESLSRHNATPEWLLDSKLGIYFTWGPYTVPAFHNEWYPWHMYRSDGHPVESYHRRVYGDPAEFNYHNFIPMFRAEHFNAEEWARLFEMAGARFAGPVAQHHDGFAMWDSDVNPWNAADKGPKRDITGELVEAIRDRGMKFITTFHHARNGQRYASDIENWGGYNSHFTFDPKYATSSENPDTAKLYGNLLVKHFNQYWYDQLKEVVDQYSPDVVWFDSWLNLIPEEYRQRFAAYYLNEAIKKKQEVVIAYKQNDMPETLGVLDIEQGGKKELSESVWLTDITLSTDSWCYVQGQQYKPADLVVRNMIDVWSKNGIVLLNISPTADGVINEDQREILKAIGEWMKEHSEAIYETRPFDYYGFGNARAVDGHFGGQSATVEYTAQDGRFLQSKDGRNLYLFMLGRPEPGSTIEIRGLAQHDFFPAGGVKKISLLRDDQEVKWGFGLRNFELIVPDVEMNQIATVFKFELN